MSIVPDYLELTKKYKAEYGDKTIVLYQVGSFYEVYATVNPDGTYSGSHIEEFARINDMNIAHKNICVGKLPVVMAGVGVAYVDKYIQRTQEHGYTIVIYKQDINAKNTTRSLAEIISPGTFFPAETEPDQLSNNIMCIWLHKTNATRFTPIQVILGISNIDIYTGKTSLFQFSADYLHSPTTYDELERYISAYRPSECLFVANMPEKIIDDIIGFVGLEHTKIHKVGLSSSSANDISANDNNAINKVNNTMQTFVKNVEKQIYQKEILKRFFPHISFIDNMFPTHYIATQSFCFLLDFVYQHNPNLVSKLSEPIFENYTDRLVLANHSLHQLNIIDDSRHTGRMRSVSSFLNNCVTTMGKRQFLYQLHYPTTNEVILNASYNITEHLLTNKTTNWQSIRTQLSSITDLEKFARKIVTKKIMPKNLVCLIEDLKIIEQLYNQTCSDSVLMGYLPAVNIQQSCREIISDVSNIFNLEECRNLSDISETSYIINKGISSTIDNLIRDNLDGQYKLEAICKFLSDMIQTTQEKSAKCVKIHETARSDAMLIATSRRIAILKEAIKSSNKSSATLIYKSKYSDTLEPFEFDLKSLEYDTSGGGKNDVVITSHQIKSITSKNEEAKGKLIRETQLIFQKYIQDFIKFDTQLHAIIKYVSEMDILQCKCYIAHKYNYCKPSIINSKDDKSFFSFTGIRHPLIEHLQTNELYVTNDMELGSGGSGGSAPQRREIGSGGSAPQRRDAQSEGSAPQRHNADNEASGVLLYGTNAVGKTSFIKSVGIAVIMAQAGLYVPCSSFVYKPYQNIFTRILGNDNLFKGLSTFAVEMTELRSILTMANKNSLVLGDELCSGTESDSALSIFTAGLEILHEKESTFLFATHFHEINKYDEIKALTRLKMMHMAVHFNKETNTLVYDRKLREGPGESMYGLEVCKSLSLPDAFLKRAHDIRMKYHADKKNILSYSSTHFNARKLMGNCELCNLNKASEVHHLQHQKNANDTNDYIQTFHKNHVANLLNICEDCHQKIHHTGQQHKVVKTTKGYVLKEVV